MVIKNKKGAALPLIMIFLAFVAFGVTALVVDAGMLYAEKKAMVTAADAAALAGAQTLQKTTGSDIPRAKQVAQNLALSNGAATASAIVENRLLNPHDKFPRQVIEVKARVVKDNFFAKLIGFNTTTVNARAVATWGYVQKYEVNSFIPIFTFSSEFDKVSSGAIQYGLHGKFDNSPPNYGFVDVGVGNVAGILSGQKIVGSIESPLTSFTGGHEDIPGGVSDRLIKAYTDYSDPLLRERYMTCLVPIIDTEGFESLNGIENIYDPVPKNGEWWDTKLTLPIKYFAYYIVEDVIKKGETRGVGASLYSSSYSSQYKNTTPTDLKQSVGIDYVSGGAVKIFGDTVSIYDCGGSAPTASVIVGRFTGETTEARIISEDGDQKFPGNVDAATYYRLIE